MFDYLIQGNGFKAIYLALSLRKKFKDKTIAIKFAGPFGGIYNSISLDNFFLDLGCHLFDYTDQRFLDIFEINSSSIIPVKLRYASINDKKLTNDYGIYDFRTCNSFLETLRKDFFNKSRTTKKEISLLDYFHNRHGPLVSQIINQFSVKITGKTLTQLDRRSHEFFLFKRILMFDNKKSLKLKKDGYDKFLAAQSQSVHNYKKKYINFTFKNGNKGFLDHILKILDKRKITCTSQDVTGNKIFYASLDNNPDLMKYSVNIPLHLCYFLSKTFPFTYLHDYSSNPIFRVSSPGHYSRQLKKNKGYLCLEIPDPNNSFDKDTIIGLSKEYLKKYCKADYFHYTFFKKSYPSVFLLNNEILENNTLNPYLYSKQSIMDEIDGLIA